MDNSHYSQAQSLFSPAQLQYNLSDDLSFNSLREAFDADRALDFRAWYDRVEGERGR